MKNCKKLYRITKRLANKSMTREGPTVKARNGDKLTTHDDQLTR